MQSTAIRLRPMTVADIEVAHRFSQAVKWPHRKEDWGFLLHAGVGIVATVDDEVAGTAMWWIFDDEIARIGMVIVDPERQKAGIGRHLMQHVLAAVGDKTIILNATEAGVPLYRRLDFKPAGSIMQHQGIAIPAAAAQPAADEKLRPATAGDAAAMIDIDARAAGTPRAGIIGALLQECDAMILEADGDIAGFAFCRPFGRGLLIGPLVARNVRAAKILISHWLAAKSGQFVRIDVPEDADLAPWLRDQALVEIAPAFTMVRGTSPTQSADFRAFGVVNQALG